MCSSPNKEQLEALYEDKALWLEANNVHRLMDRQGIIATINAKPEGHEREDWRRRLNKIRERG